MGNPYGGNQHAFARGKLSVYLAAAFQHDRVMLYALFIGSEFLFNEALSRPLYMRRPRYHIARPDDLSDIFGDDLKYVLGVGGHGSVIVRAANSTPRRCDEAKQMAFTYIRGAAEFRAHRRR